MNSVVDKYFSSRKDELCNYSSLLINFYKYDKDDSLFNNKSETISSIKKIVLIYFEKYYLSNYVNYKPVNKFYNFPPTIDDDFKSILLAGIKYFQGEEINIPNNSYYLLYLSSIIYISHLFYKFRFTIVNNESPTKFINDIVRKISKSFNFTSIDFNNKKELTEIHKMLKDVIRKDNKTNNILNNYKDDDSFNEYITINKTNNIYKIKYNYEIKALESYKVKDTKRIMNNNSYDDSFKFISLQLALLTLLKSLIRDKDNYFCLEVDSKFLKKKTNVNKLLKLLKNKYSIDHIKLLIKYSDYVKNDNVLLIIQSGIEIILDYDAQMVFDKDFKLDREVLLIPIDIVTKNKEKIDSDKIKYIVKDNEETFNEVNLLDSIITKEEK